MVKYKFWDIVALFYTRFMRKNDASFDSICRETAPFLKPNMRVLEIGCGTGQITQHLVHKTAEWIATDFSPEMVRITANTVTHPHLTCVVEDATCLSFRNDAFDAVIIANVLHIIPEPDKALREIQRVLKTDGLLIAPTFVFQTERKPLMLWFMECIGFEIHSKWTASEFENYIVQNKFDIVKSAIHSAKPLPELNLIAKKITI